MEYCNIFIAEYQYNQYNNNIIVPSADYEITGLLITVLWELIKVRCVSVL